MSITAKSEGRTQRVIEWNRRNRGVDADLLCALGDRGGVDPRRDYDAIVRERVPGDPNFAVAEFLRELECRRSA
jgi:hypothetical protein